MQDYQITETVQNTSKIRVYRAYTESDKTFVLLKIYKNQNPNLSELDQCQNELKIADDLKLLEILKPCKIEQYQGQSILIF